MKKVLLLAVIAVVGCNNSTQQDTVGELGWDFNYRDWTKASCSCADLEETDCGSTAGCTWDGDACSGTVTTECTEDDIRSCDNNPGVLQGAPVFPEISQVSINLESATSGATIFDREVDCTFGEVGVTFPLQGFGRIEYFLRLRGLTEGGDVVYTHLTPFSLDLSELAVHRFSLQTTVGDIAFGAQFLGTPAPFLCPDSTVDRFRWEVFTVPAGGGDGESLISGVQDACEDEVLGNIVAKRIYIRNIPVAPEQGPSGIILDTYRVRVEAIDASDTVLYCGDNTRPVSPGPNVLQNTLDLNAGACP